MDLDSVGKKFGQWTVLGIEVKILSSGKRYILRKVKCSCGTASFVTLSDLKSGKSTKCRKCAVTSPLNLIGEKFGEWLVLNKSLKKNKTYWLCRCSCGNEVEVSSSSLIQKVSTKCLNCCYKSREKHGYTVKQNKHPLYSIWKTMIGRCENPKNSMYYNYGAKGIKVCEKWHSLETFAKDIGKRPTKKHSVDRVNNLGDYSPENCRWADSKEQNRNKSTNRFIKYQNKNKCIIEWAEELKVKKDTLLKYLTRNTFDKAYNHFNKNINEES